MSRHAIGYRPMRPGDPVNVHGYYQRKAGRRVARRVLRIGLLFALGLGLLMGLMLALSTYALDRVTCQATWYGARYHGRLTASGERFDRMAYTVALNWLPLGTPIRLTYKDHELYARVNDRMPTGTPGWAVDCSEGIASEMGWREAGRVELLLEVIQ